MRPSNLIIHLQQLKRQHYQPVLPLPERQGQQHRGQLRQRGRNNRRQLRVWENGGEVLSDWMPQADKAVRATSKVEGTKGAGPENVLTSVKHQLIGKYPQVNSINPCAGVRTAHQCHDKILSSVPAYGARVLPETLRLSLLEPTYGASCLHRLTQRAETSTITSVAVKFFSTLPGAAAARSLYGRNLYVHGSCSKYGPCSSIPIWQGGAIRAKQHPMTRALTFRTPVQVYVGVMLQRGSSTVIIRSSLRTISSAGRYSVCILSSPEKRMFCVPSYMQPSRSLFTSSASKLLSVSSQKENPSQEMPAVAAFSLGTGWGSVLLWLASFTGLLGGVTYIGKGNGGDNAEEADEVAVPHRRRSTNDVHEEKLSNENAKHLKTGDKGRRDVGSLANSKDTQQDFLVHARAGDSSPHYPGEMLPSTEVVLENRGFTSIFSASRRQPILVAEKLTPATLRSCSPSLLQKELQDQPEQQQQVSPDDQEEELCSEMMQLWGGASPSDTSQNTELKEYSENAEESQANGSLKSQYMRGETALLMSQQQQYTMTKEGDANRVEPAMPIGAPSPRDRIRFVQDPRLDTLWSPSPSDYVNSGYTRGHMAAAALHSASREELKSTFSLGANIVPQLFSVNSGLWRRLEALCQYLIREYDEVFVVSGPLWLPGDLECRWPHVFVTPGKESTNMPQKSNNSQLQKTAEGSGNGAASNKYGFPPPVMYTCLRPYKDAREFYAVSHESLTGAPSPGPPPPKVYSRINRSGSFSGSRGSQKEDYILTVLGKDSSFPGSQPLEVGLALCKKALYNFQPVEWECELDEAAEGKPALKTSDGGEAAEAWQRRRSTGMRNGKFGTGEVPRGQEAPLWPVTANGNSASDSEEEDQYLHLLPGAAVLRSRLQAPARPLHVAHETIGTRQVSVPTHFYKIILAVRRNSKSKLQSGVDGSGAGTKQRGSRGSGVLSAGSSDSFLPPVILGAFLVPNQEMKARKVDLRSVRVPIGFLEFASGLSFQGIVRHATKRVLQAAHEHLQEDIFPENIVEGGPAAPSAKVPVVAQ